MKLASTCQWQLVTVCTLNVRGPLSGSSGLWLGSVCGSFLGGAWARVLSPGQPCAVCVCILAEEGGAWEGGGADRGGGWPEELAGEAEPLGVSELRLYLEGNSSLKLPVSAVSGFLPCRPLPHRGRRASPHRMQIVGKFTSVSF